MPKLFSVNAAIFFKFEFDSKGNHFIQPLQYVFFSRLPLTLSDLSVSDCSVSIDVALPKDWNETLQKRATLKRVNKASSEDTEETEDPENPSGGNTAGGGPSEDTGNNGGGGNANQGGGGDFPGEGD